MKDEIKEEVERQLAERDGRRRTRRAAQLALVLALFGATGVLAQQHNPGVGGSLQMADLFKRFFTWDASNNITSVANSQTANNFVTTKTTGTTFVINSITAAAASASTPGMLMIPTNSLDAADAIWGIGNEVGTILAYVSYDAKSHFNGDLVGGASVDAIMRDFVSTAASGSYALFPQTSGAKVGLGPGASSYLQEVSNGYITSPSYFASVTPFTLASVYVNNTIAAFTYGGMKLPARAFTVTNVAYNIRTIGSGGSTNNTFQISDGTNTCTCTFACNQAAASQIATCSNGAGTGCVYAASAALTFGFSAVGDCSTATDILGNMEVLGNWQ